MSEADSWWDEWFEGDPDGSGLGCGLALALPMVWMLTSLLAPVVMA